MPTTLKWIVSFWIISSSLSLAAQNLEETWSFGEELMVLGQYESAALTFERILLFDKEKQYPEAIIKVADCHKRSGNYIQAAGFYQQAYFAVKSDSLQNEMILQKTFCLLQGREFQAALAELFHLSPNGSEAYLNRRDFYLGIAHFGAERFAEAEKHFKSWLERSAENSSRAEEDLAILFDENDKISRLNPRKARMMSLIIPGSGQIYAGDWRNGLNSLAITGGLYYLFFINAQQTTYWESLLIVFPWFQRYYSGGMDAAYRITKNKKAARRADKYREIIQLLRHAQ